MNDVNNEQYSFMVSQPVDTCKQHVYRDRICICLRSVKRGDFVDVAFVTNTMYASPVKRFRSAELLLDCIVRQTVQCMPHNTYLYLHRTDRESVCCQQALYGACKQCDAQACCDAVALSAGDALTCLRKR